jgi:hypothetical protein
VGALILFLKTKRDKQVVMLTAHLHCHFIDVSTDNSEESDDESEVENKFDEEGEDDDEEQQFVVKQV